MSSFPTVVRLSLTLVAAPAEKYFVDEIALQPPAAPCGRSCRPEPEYKTPYLLLWGGGTITKISGFLFHLQDVVKTKTGYSAVSEISSGLEGCIEGDERKCKQTGLRDSIAFEVMGPKISGTLKQDFVYVWNERGKEKDELVCACLYTLKAARRSK